MADNKQIYFLEGGPELDDECDFRLLSDSYECDKITNLYKEPEKLYQLKEDNPWGIYILTTGLRFQHKSKLIETFLDTNYIPEAIIFGSEKSALEYCDIARKLKEEHGTISYELDFFDEELREISWI